MSYLSNLKSLISRIVDNWLYNVRTHLPAQVVSYDSTANTCSVQPCVKQLKFVDPDKTEVNLPQLDDVPVAQCGSGKLLLSVAPQVGSYGTIHVFDRSIAEWLESGGIVTPANIRRHSLSDALFVPDLYPLVEDGDNGLIATGLDTDRISLRTRTGSTKISVLDNESVEVKNENATVTIAVNGEITCDCPKFIVNSEADSAALASKVDSLFTQMDTVIRTTWVPVAQDGGAALKTAWTATTAPTTVASDSLKVDG